MTFEAKINMSMMIYRGNCSGKLPYCAVVNALPPAATVFKFYNGVADLPLYLIVVLLAITPIRLTIMGALHVMFTFALFMTKTT